MPASFDIAAFATWFVAFLFSTTCHEAAHALLGRIGGDRTAEDQVTLNPFPHMKREPFGMVVMPLLSGFSSGGQALMGWASAPFDPAWAQRHPKRAALMSAAGPLTNFLLCAIAIVVLRAFAFSLGEIAVRLVFVLAVLNGLLGVFNLLPLPPLDGAGVLEGLGGAPARWMIALRSSAIGSLLAFGAALLLFRYVTPFVAGTVLTLAGVR